MIQVFSFVRTVHLEVTAQGALYFFVWNMLAMQVPILQLMVHLNAPYVVLEHFKAPRDKQHVLAVPLENRQILVLMIVMHVNLVLMPLFLAHLHAILVVLEHILV